MTLDMLTQLGGSGAREAWAYGLSFNYAFDMYHVAITLTARNICAQSQVRTDLYPFCYGCNRSAPYLLLFGDGRIYVCLNIFIFSHCG